MEVVYARCAGADVHKDTVVVCVRIQDGGDGRARTETRTFGTTTKALGELGAWLDSEGVTHLVMEATGVYWKPVWHVLDDGERTLLLGNARELRNVPGRKSDASDSAWLADLLAHGLVRSSFVPDEGTFEMRDLTRTRKQFVREQTRAVQRVQKVLEDANIKLDSVLSDVMGKSGRLMVEAIIGGEKDPEELAACASPRLKATHEEIVEAAHGRITKHHRFMLKIQLAAYDEAAARIAKLDKAIEVHLRPFRDAVERIKAMPGISDVSAAAIVAEIGLDMSRFRSAAALIAWACLCPRMDESAGKRRNTRIGKGANWIKTTLVQCANAAAKVKKSYFQAQYLRIKSRRGHNKAIIAVAASMLTAIYHVLRDGTPFLDLGRNYFDARDESKVVHKLEHRLIQLGYEVQLVKKTA